MAPAIAAGPGGPPGPAAAARRSIHATGRTARLWILPALLLLGVSLIGLGHCPQGELQAGAQVGTATALPGHDDHHSKCHGLVAAPSSAPLGANNRHAGAAGSPDVATPSVHHSLVDAQFRADLTAPPLAPKASSGRLLLLSLGITRS